MKRAHASYLDHVRTGSSDIRTHAVQEVRHIHHMRLFCHIFHDGKSFGHCRCHHHVDRSAYRNHIKIEMCSLQMLRFRNDLAVLDIYIGAKRPESFQMLVDRPAADIASARQSHFRSFILSEQRAQQIVGRSDLFNIVIFNIKIRDRTAVDLDGMSVQPLDHRSDAFDGF